MFTEFYHNKAKLFNFHIFKNDWLAGEFRDCNGESNGINLPDDVLKEEVNCSDDKGNTTANLSINKKNEEDLVIRIPSLVSI